MKKYAHIPEVKQGVVFSDPSYDESVWCQFRKDFQATDWLMKMDTLTENHFVTFQLTLGRPTILAGVEIQPTEEDYSIVFPGRFDFEQYEIGMDTASVFCGLGEHFSSFAEEAAIHTGTDGSFGSLMVFTCRGENDPAGFLLTGGIDEIFMSEQALSEHFLASFSANEITQEKYMKITSPANLQLRLAASEELKHAAEHDGPQWHDQAPPQR